MIICKKEVKRFRIGKKGLSYHNWIKCVGLREYKLKFEFMRINSRVYLLGKRLPLGFSYFISKAIPFKDFIKQTVWYMPFIIIKPFEAKYHYSNPNTPLLISFSVSNSDINKINVSDLDNKRIKFNVSYNNDQKLLKWNGELYPSENSVFKEIK